MKIGVALSGCDIGGMGAYVALRMLEQTGLPLAMLSACGVPSAAVMLYAYGYTEEAYTQLGERFLADCKEAGVGLAVARLAAQIVQDGDKAKRIPFVVSGARLADGHVCAFTDDFAIGANNLTTLPVNMLHAEIISEEARLCDYSVWHGCPLAPLHLAGMERTISLAFFPAVPATPYAVLLRQRVRTSADVADVHFELALPPEGCAFAAYTAAIEAQLQPQLPSLMTQLLG